MKIADLVKGVRQEIAGMISPESKATGFSAGFVNLWDMVSGKMQPTDYVKQVASNEGWVYACVAAIAESCAMAKLTLHAKRGDKVEAITDHIFLDVWQNVNPFMNNFDLQELTEFYQLLCGNAYWWLGLNGLGVPQEIWPVAAQYMTIIPDKRKFISGYLYAPPGGSQIAFGPEEIVHFKYANPNNIFYGMSPLFAAAYSVDNEEYMDRFQSAQFKHGGLPQALLSSDQVIHDPEAKRIKEQWKQNYGGVDRAGKIAVLGKGMKFQPIQMTAVEMAFVQSRNTNRDKILAIFRVPKSILGLVDDVNRANAEATDYIFSSRVIKPKLIRKQEKINEKIMPMYKQNGSTKIFVQYVDPVPADRITDTTERTARLVNGVTTINEEREKLGLEDVEWGNVPLMPIAIAPLGSEPAMPAPRSETTQEEDAIRTQDEKRKWAQKYFTRARVWTIYKARFDSETYYMRNIMRRLFRKQKKDVLDRLANQFTKSIKADVDSIIFIMAEWEDEFAKQGGPAIANAYEGGARHGNRIAGLGTAFNIDNPVAQAFIKEKTLQFSFDVNETTSNQLKDEINAGLKAGETHAQLADRVEKVFEFGERYRAMRIARTEVADVENHAILDQWSQSERVEGKEWLHGGGGFEPRPEHVAMSGERVKVGERFSNGLSYPGDPAGGPSEIIDCTCTILPVFELKE